MEIVKGKTLRDIDHDTRYEGCAFYLKDAVITRNVTFNNCSFRQGLFLTACEDTIFEECNFSGQVQLYMEYGEQKYPPLSLTNKVEHLCLGRFREDLLTFFHNDWSNLSSIKFMLCNLRSLPNDLFMLPSLKLVQMNKDLLLYSQIKNTTLTLTTEKTGEVFTRNIVETNKHGVLEFTPLQLIGYTKGFDSGKNDIVFLEQFGGKKQCE